MTSGKYRSALVFLCELWTESTRTEKQNLILALVAVVVLIACVLSWFVWHEGWLSVGLLVLAGVITKPLYDEFDELYR